MADIKISELGAASAVNNTDLFPMTSAGVTVKATAQQIKNYVGVGNLSDLDTNDKTSAVAAINEVDGHADTAQATANNAQQMIAPIQSNLTAPKTYAVGEQFIYNGLLYKATASIAQGSTITIGGNCALADSVTEQIKDIDDKLNIETFSLSKNSNAQTMFTGYGIFDKTTRTVRLYLSFWGESSGGAAAVASIGALYAAYRPVSLAFGVGIINGNGAKFEIGTDGTITNNMTLDPKSGMMMAEYQI